MAFGDTVARVSDPGAQHEDSMRMLRDVQPPHWSRTPWLRILLGFSGVILIAVLALLFAR
jgi:hypothetical protein